MDYEKINDSLNDEYEDVVKYVKFYKESDNVIFRDIAREEFIHAKHIKEILKDAGKLELSSALETKAKEALDDV